VKANCTRDSRSAVHIMLSIPFLPKLSELD
jgi:hypothetical protein